MTSSASRCWSKVDRSRILPRAHRCLAGVDLGPRPATSGSMTLVDAADQPAPVPNLPSAWLGDATRSDHFRPKVHRALKLRPLLYDAGTLVPAHAIVLPTRPVGFPCAEPVPQHPEESRAILGGGGNDGFILGDRLSSFQVAFGLFQILLASLTLFRQTQFFFQKG